MEDAEKKIVRNHLGKFLYSEINYIINSIKGELNYKQSSLWKQLSFYRLELFVVEIVNLNIFHSSDRPEWGSLYQNNLLNSLYSFFGSMGIVRRIDPKKIMIISPFKDENTSIRNNLDFLLSSPVKLEDNKSILPIFRVGFTDIIDVRDLKPGLKKADVALNYAAFNSTNRFLEFTESLQTQYNSYLFINTHIESAIVNNELTVVFQPQCNAENKVLGFEVLIRWNSAERGGISPEYFIPILEQTGQISTISRYVIKEACKFINKCNVISDSSIKVSINISPFEIIRRDFIEEMIEIVNLYKVSPDQLKIELTENGIANNMLIIKERLRTLSSLGFSISIDDFGKDYSSLSEIKNFSVHGLKIDKSFLTQVPAKEKYSNLLEAIIVFSRSIQLDLIVEGVETQEQLDFLIYCGCSQFQGYYFSKPLIETNALIYLKDNQLNYSCMSVR